LSPDEFTALERVAVMSDEIAERVGMFVEEPQAVPYIPGRKRWTVSYKGEEIVKPLRRQLKMLAKIRHCGSSTNIPGRGRDGRYRTKEKRWSNL